MNAADRRRLTPTLGSVAGVLLLVLIALWLGLGRGSHWRDDAPPPRLPPLGATTPPPTVQPLEHYAEVWERPLFSPTRTPEAAGGNNGAASSDLVLTGVIMLPDLKMAILHDKSTNKDYRVIQGRPARDAPALVELHPRSAVVEASGSRVSLQLIPGPSSDAGSDQNATQPSSDSGDQGGSAMVTRQGGDAAQAANGQAAAAARARQLKARIQASRRRAEQGGG